MAFWRFAGEALTEGAFIKILSGLWNMITTVSPDIQKKVPKWFGLTLDDEQIFNGVLGQLKPKEQILITNFLFECKDYERNRFVNIVAGMEVVEKGKLDEKKESFDDNGKKVIETKSSSKDKKDKREEFLRSFAKVISEEFNEDFDKVHEFCVAGRIIIPDPMHQKVLRNFSESVGWFKKVVLAPFGAESAEDLLQKTKQKFSENSNDLNNSAQSFEDKARAFYERSKGGRRS